MQYHDFIIRSCLEMENRMTRTYKLIWVLITLLTLLLSACNLNEATPNPDSFYTQAAETMVVAQALTALVGSPTPTETPTASTNLTPEATNTPLITESTTPGATTIPIKTNTPRPAQSQACDNALFIDDITYPDYSEIPAGAIFLKTWRFKNLGPCTWTTEYKIVFSYVSDTGKDGIFTPPAPANFPSTVLPGEEVDLSIHLRAPTKADGYIVVFRLQNDKGYFFGAEFWTTFVVK
jgi:hypothetical protein